MANNKYNKVLTITLIVVVVAILVVIGVWGVDTYNRYYINREATSEAEQFQNDVQSGRRGNRNNYSNTTENTANENTIELDPNALQLNTTTGDNGNSGSSSSNVASRTYKGFTMLGTIEIPSINLNYPVLAQATKSSMEVSVGVIYGPGLNKVGNTVITGHNYRNGTFFSNVKNVKNNDLIYITDNDGNRVKYKVYNTYETSSTDFDYATRETEGKREITLSTCTDDVKSRIIVWAREAE